MIRIPKLEEQISKMATFNYSKIKLAIISQSKYDSLQELLETPDFDRGLITVKEEEGLPDLTNDLFERIGEQYRASGMIGRFLNSKRFR